jgi:hypothetical protein
MPGLDSGSSSDGAGTVDGGATDSGSTADSNGSKSDGGTTFKRHTVDPMLAGAAYASVADMDNDGKPEIIVSSFGTISTNIPSGQVRIYKRGADFDTWTAEIVVPESEGVKFPNQNSIDDIDSDGDLDILVPAGFFTCNITFIADNKPCGAMLWYERTPSGFVKHVLTSDEVRFYHSGVLLDIDGDGVRDLVTVAEEQMIGADGGVNAAQTLWFKGTSAGDHFQTTKRVLGEGLGGFPRPRDIDGDGDIDFAAAEFYQAGESFAWLENKGIANLPWEKHAINIDSGRAIQLALVDNLYGDGMLHAIGSNHTNTAKVTNPDPQESAVFVFDKPTDPKQLWTKHQISQGIVSVAGSSMSAQFAPGIFGAGDIDGDGDIDIAVSGDGDPNVYWLEQTGPGTWLTHLLDVGLEQAGGMVITDLNGDGKNEIVVTGYTDNVVYVYERE